MTDYSALREIGWISAHPSSINRMVFSPSGRLFVSSSNDGACNMFDCSRNDQPPRLVHTLEQHDDYADDVAWSPDGTKVATCDGNGLVVLHDALMGATLQRWIADSTGVSAVCFSPDSRRLVTGSYDGDLRTWDVATRSELSHLDAHSGGVATVAFLPGGDKLLSGADGGEEGAVSVSTVGDGAVLWRHQSSQSTVAVSPSSDGSLCAVAFAGGAATVFSAADGSVVNELSGLCPPTDLGYVVWSPDDSVIVTASNNNIAVTDVESGAALAELPLGGARATAVAISPDARHLAVGGAGGEILSLVFGSA